MIAEARVCSLIADRKRDLDNSNSPLTEGFFYFKLNTTQGSLMRGQPYHPQKKPFSLSAYT